MIIGKAPSAHLIAATREKVDLPREDLAWRRHLQICRQERAASCASGA
jgi:hypothetical protein